jgi:type I restriction enzyme M protein
MIKAHFSETETVIKKILPYLIRRGYDVKNDLSFESPTADDGITRGYIDILVSIDMRKCFVIEAKKISKKLDSKDKAQALKYAKSEDVPFAVLTNGVNIYCFNTVTGERITFDGNIVDKLPTRAELPKVLKLFISNKKCCDISLSDKLSLPYRQGLSQRQLNFLFEKCHNLIRKLEHNEQDAFEDFSKILFLKLLEEKAENEAGKPNAFKLPYSYRFYELAKIQKEQADQVRVAVGNMIENIKRITKYSDVLGNGIGLHNSNTYYEIVKNLDKISFSDCSTDVKGSAFEYYVRATLKGRKLGQYFTPRNLVRLMYAILGEEKIYDTIKNLDSGKKFKILDPACGTAGFLVYMLQRNLKKLDDEHNRNQLTDDRFKEIRKRIKENTFYGSDANPAVAAAAKMNMIIAGDGQTNIINENSLGKNAENWSVDNADVDIIVTNPPFGTSENGSLSEEDMTQYTMNSKKGQVLFLEKMIKSTKGGGEIFTVIDQGIINTDTNIAIRRYILQECWIKAIVELPIETFKPNKINVKSSLLYLKRKTEEEIQCDQDYFFYLVKVNTLGYDPTGKDLRGFNIQEMIDDITANLFENTSSYYEGKNGYWCFHYMKASDIKADSTVRFDHKFIDPSTRAMILDLYSKSKTKVKDVNTIKTSRGKSPDTEQYVDENDGYAVVIKAGNITKYGTIELNESDWIEKAVFEEYETMHNHCNIIAMKGDVLVASTGDGTLGKTAVYDQLTPAIVDGHVTIIRVDPNRIDPYYLAGYLRKGAGAIQINRAYTGATGLIELTPEQLDAVVVDTLGDNVNEQIKMAKQLRKLEKQAIQYLQKAEEMQSKSYNVMM